MKMETPFQYLSTVTFSQIEALLAEFDVAHNDPDAGGPCGSSASACLVIEARACEQRMPYKHAGCDQEHIGVGSA